jgi:hypothetical protein
MTTGNCLVNNIDIYVQYGAYIAKGGYNDLLLLPPLKAPDTVDWPDRDGLSVDLSNPLLAPREVTIPFVVTQDFESFATGMSHPRAMVTIPSLSYNTSYLRYVSTVSCKRYKEIVLWTIKMAEDDYRPPENLSPPPGDTPDTGYTIDGVNVKNYGLMVNGEERHKPASAKKNMNYTTADMSSVYYDTGTLYKSSREIIFKCRLNAASGELFYKCRQTLLYVLTQPGLRTIRNKDGETYKGYYKNTSGGKLISMRGAFTFDFNLTFLQTTQL